MLRAALAACALGVACDTAVHQGGTDAAVSASCLEAAQRSDYPWIADNVFRTSCSLSSSCHSGARPAGRLNLTPLRAHEQLVGVTAISEAGWVRVVPGSPETSYLMVKLGTVAGPLGDAGTTMPPNSPPLCSEKLDAVRRWIAGGAHGTQPDAGVSDASIDASVEAPVDAGPTE